MNRLDLNQDLLYLSDRPDSHEAIRTLLHSRANVNAIGQEGWTPVQNAILRNNTALVYLFLSEPTFDVDQVTYRCDEAKTALLMAIALDRLELAKLFVFHGADLFFVNPNGENAMHILARRGAGHNHKRIESFLDFLVERGAGPCLFAPDTHGKYPIDVIGRYANVRTLFHKAMEDTRIVYRAALSTFVFISVLVDIIVQYM